jgi:hypothetical protein
MAMKLPPNSAAIIAGILFFALIASFSVVEIRIAANDGRAHQHTLKWERAGAFTEGGDEAGAAKLGGDEAGLAIQKEVADETEQLAEFTKWLVIATAILGIAAFWQVAITRNTARRQLRAYLLIDGIEFARPTTDNADNEPWLVHIMYKNWGQTPAFETVITSEIEIGAAKEEDRPLLLSKKAETSPVHVIPPGHRHTLRRLGLSHGLAQFHANRMAGTRAYAWGRIDYVDIFGKRHFTRFQQECVFGQVLQFRVIGRTGNDTDDRLASRFPSLAIRSG